MNVLIDQWTPFFQELESRVNAEGRRKLLSQLIGDVYDVTVLNLGPDGKARPKEWRELNARYAEKYHDGNRTPTLVLSGDLKAGFDVDFNSEFATLTNTVEYAYEHQFGSVWRRLPARPFYPVDETGINFTDYMVNRLNGILDSHFQL